jgi:hypothetical protein
MIHNLGDCRCGQYHESVTYFINEPIENEKEKVSKIFTKYYRAEYKH